MMDAVAKRERYWWEQYPLHKWWCNDLCPLVPRFHYRKGNEFNSNNWQVHWLIFNIWSLEHFSFGVDAGLSFAPIEVYVGAIFPYLRVMIGIRSHWTRWSFKVIKFFQRKPAIRKPDHE